MKLDEQGYSLLEIMVTLCLLFIFSASIITITTKMSNLTEGLTKEREFAEAAQSLGIEYLENIYYKNVSRPQVKQSYSWQELDDLDFELAAQIPAEIKEKIKFQIELLSDAENYNIYQLIISLADLELTFFYLDEEAG